MDNLMDTLMAATALNRDSTSDQTTPEARTTNNHQYPRSGWNAADVKRCLGYTDVQYSNLYNRVEEAMRHADLIEVSLTGPRKTKLVGILDRLLPHDSMPALPDYLRIKALHQLATKINGNIKKRSGHAQHRTRIDKKRGPPIRVTTAPAPGRPPSAPSANPPNLPSLRTPQSRPPTVDVGPYCGLGSMLLVAERDNKTQSTCSLKHIVRNVGTGAPITVDTVSFDAWRSLLEKDGVLRGPDDDVTISWKWDGRLIQVPNERVLRTVVEFMSTHGGFLDFRLESVSVVEQVLVLVLASILIFNAETLGERSTRCSNAFRCLKLMRRAGKLIVNPFRITDEFFPRARMY